MAQVPKYQAIHAVLRQRILDGEYPAGTRLPAQQDLADAFDVTLMTLRQAIAALESDGLVWAARGKGTFVVDAPVDLRLDNLSSFAAQMQSAGVEMTTSVVSVESTDDPPARVVAALGPAGPVTCVTRLRSVADVPIALQRSWFASEALPGDTVEGLSTASLYDTFEEVAGWSVSEARESISAVPLDASDAGVLDTEPGHPSILSIRTSVDQFGRPFLYDEALLVGGRTTITADRTSDRLSMRYRAADRTGRRPSA